MNRTRPLLDQQIAYYRARAPEYEDWFWRRGRYDLGPDHTRQWFIEVGEVEAALRLAEPRGSVLEIACGTGIWTRILEPLADRLTAVDASPEVLELNRARLGGNNVRFEQVDIFTWHPTELYDFVFFGFWLSHVPPAAFESFWAGVGRALRRGGRVFFVDSAQHGRHTAIDPAEAVDVEGSAEWIVRRDLADGREFDIVKIIYDPKELESRLAGLGWRGRICTTESSFVYGDLVVEEPE